MGKLYHRSQRVGAQIQRDLAVLIRDRLNDPRLAMLTISAVDLSKDFSSAKVYFRLMGDDEANSAEQILKQATPFLRKELGRGIRLRVVPQLLFVYDHAIDRGQHLEKLIGEAVEQDKRNK